MMNPLPPAANSYYRATERGRPASTPWLSESRVDVAIVGGGFVGLSCALHLARAGVRVCVLEQGDIGFGASGRNGGQVHVGMRRDQWWLESQFGVARAHELWDYALEARRHLDELLARYQIECDFKPGLIHVNHKAKYDVDTQHYVDHLSTQYGYDALQYWSKDQMQTELSAQGYYGGCFDARGGHLHPLNFTLGIARAALSEGARLYTDVCVRSLDTQSAIKRVVTSRGVIEASHVVLAANGYLGALEPKVARRVMPINNFIATTVPLGERASTLIKRDAAVSDSRFVVNYFRRTADGRMLFGGGENYSYRFPSDIGAFVRPFLEKVFPQLKGVALDYAWGWTLAITPNRMPYIRELNPGYMNASGFSGLGVVLAPMVGKSLAQALLGDRDVFERLAQLPSTAFPGGQWFRSPALVAAMLFYALRDRL